MTIDELEAFLSRVISFPLKEQIKVDFDKSKKIFRLSVIIYRSAREVPASVQKYVNARKGMSFRPHQTSYHLTDVNEVHLVQEFPFQWGFQPTVRHRVVEFWQLAKRCYQMLAEIAAEEFLASRA